MIGLLLTTGLVAMAIVVLVVTALFADASRPRELGTPEVDTADAPSPPQTHRPEQAIRPQQARAPEQATRPEQPPGPSTPFAGPTSLSLRARLAFVHSPEPHSIVLDCTLEEFDDDTGGVVPIGAPFTLQLRLPETTWFATSLELLLEQWAAESRVVEIALQARDGHAKAHVGDGSSRLMLEVDSAAGLSVG